MASNPLCFKEVCHISSCVTFRSCHWWHVYVVCMFSRYVLICKPHLYPQIYTFKTSIICCLGVWLLAHLLTMPNHIGKYTGEYMRPHKGDKPEALSSCSLKQFSIHNTINSMPKLPWDSNTIQRRCSSWCKYCGYCCRSTHLTPCFFSSCRLGSQSLQLWILHLYLWHVCTDIHPIHYSKSVGLN